MLSTVGMRWTPSMFQRALELATGAANEKMAKAVKLPGVHRLRDGVDKYIELSELQAEHRALTRDVATVAKVRKHVESALKPFETIYEALKKVHAKVSSVNTQNPQNLQDVLLELGTQKDRIFAALNTQTKEGYYVFGGGVKRQPFHTRQSTNGNAPSVTCLAFLPTHTTDNRLSRLSANTVSTPQNLQTATEGPQTLIANLLGRDEEYALRGPSFIGNGWVNVAAGGAAGPLPHGAYVDGQQNEPAPPGVWTPNEPYALISRAELLAQGGLANGNNALAFCGCVSAIEQLMEGSVRPASERAASKAEYFEKLEITIAEKRAKVAHEYGSVLNPKDPQQNAIELGDAAKQKKMIDVYNNLLFATVSRSSDILKNLTAKW
ncbi:hypothetical protein FACS189481_3570 [Clostridia bacterium]|nr:hypothetical protein FACS189481_3570 [Clostridia bacterium]